MRKIYKHRQLYILLLPTLLYYLIFCYAPMFGLTMAFQDFSITKGFFRSEFIGFDNFTMFFNDTNFWRLLKNTLSISLWQLTFAFPLPIVFALALNEISSARFKRVVQTVTYMPYFISLVVVSGLVLTFVSSDGLINTIYSMLGLKKVSFMTNPDYFYPIYTISNIWQHLGWDSIIYIAALAGIDQVLYEAAQIDGAGRWKQLIHVTLPGIAPTIIILLVLKIGSLMSVGYEKIMLLYNPTIYSKADVISTYVYKRGLIDTEYSYSAAVGMFNSIINFILLVSANFISKKTTETGLW